jgi:MGT family glycosyltransferase
MPREFDPWPEPPPANLTHVGPIFEELAAPTWESPWPAEDRRPLVVVSLGSTYMHQEPLLGRIATALSGLDARALLLTGHELDPGELSLDPGVEVRSYVPHSAVLPEAALVVTHAGVGTLLASFAAGVPTLCLPLGRDQDDNAEQLRALGAGVVLDSDAGVEEIRASIAAALDSSSLRESAARMAAAVASYGDGGLRAAEIVEQGTVSRYSRSP